MSKIKGNRELILAASSVAQVQMLRDEVVNHFGEASAKTIRRCERAAKLRISQLNLNQPHGN